VVLFPTVEESLLTVVAAHDVDSLVWSDWRSKRIKLWPLTGCLTSSACV
jgi:hypothetical protein